MPVAAGSGPFQQRILGCLSDEEMRTCREVAAKTGIAYETTRFTMRALGKRGLVRDTGERGGDNSRQKYWVITDDGIEKSSAAAEYVHTRSTEERLTT